MTNPDPILTHIARASLACTNAGIAAQVLSEALPEAERSRAISHWLDEIDTQIAAIRAELVHLRRAA